jgi:glucose/arabinose dehydrogenase
MHTRGNLAGVYGSTLCDTGLSDFLTISNVPDAIWPARWYHNTGDGFYDPNATVWNLGSCVPNTVWADHQRIRQYEGDHNETWGALTLGIDSNVLDGVVAVPYVYPTLDPAKVSFQEFVSGLSNPVFITNAADSSGRIFVVERGGRIRIIKNGMLIATPFLDIQSIVKSTSSEQGLLGLAFHPSYESNGKFYVLYTAPRTGDSNGSVLTLRQYSVSVGDPDVANTNSGINILTIDHPMQTNHNGGTIAFGNDGYLYWSTGDGGGGGDPSNNAQNLTSLLGKILRLDVDSGSPYAVPATNPFYSSANINTKLIWAYGLRNPWRMSFDRVMHDLYIGDVGQSNHEEINFQSANSTGGENYGWRIMEGSYCYNPSSGCDQTGKILPVAEYNHSLGCSVTGGNVYRGSDFPSLVGHYIYGDFCTGRVFSIYNNLPMEWGSPVQLADTTYSISTFGEDENGELYLADYGTGKIYKIEYVAEAKDPTFGDVPSTHPYYEYIEALYANGLTNGCNSTPLLYCPDLIMNRAQVAKFFMTVEYGGSYLPPVDTPHLFLDNWKKNPWAEIWANDMKVKELTSGCNLNPLLYCPDMQIPREQVAKFALTIKHGNAYIPPAATGTLFADLTDVGYWATACAEQAYLEGLVPACGTDAGSGKPKFCPKGLVDRGFASFVIVTATGLLGP